MDKEDREKLTTNLTKLISHTYWTTSLENKLLENKVFTPKTLDPINSIPDEDKRKQELYLGVQRRGPQAFQRLLKSLQESDNFEAARILDSSIAPPTPELRHSPPQRQNKVWNEPTYNKPIPEPIALPPNFEEAEVRDDKTPLSVRVRPAQQVTFIPNRTYPMCSKPRGHALIIDNEEFENDIMTKREGSLIDANNLDILFGELGFQVTLRRNLRYIDLMAAVSDFSRKPDLASADMCVVIMLSHGDSGLIYSSDGRQVQTEWVLRQFNNEGCPALKGKPKFFILQACRGDEPDYGYIPKIGFTDSTTATDASAIPASQLADRIHKEPTWEDMLIAYATVPGYVANRNHYRGSWFVESICDVFMNQAWELDIRELLDEVSHKMKFYESEFGTKQSCSYEVRHFYKKLYFNPGLFEVPITSDTPDGGAGPHIRTGTKKKTSMSRRFKQLSLSLKHESAEPKPKASGGKRGIKNFDEI